MTPHEIRFGINGLTGLVVLSVAAAAANLTWRLAGEAGGASAVSAATAAYVPPAPPPDISAMVNLPPFGRVVVAPTVAAARTDLILRGVLMANPATASTALIAAAGQDSIAYRIGDPLPGGIILGGIGVDYVLLRQGDQMSTLYFPDDERAGKADPAVAAPPAARPFARPGEAAPGSAPSGVDAMRALIPPSARGTSPGQAAPPPAAPPPAAPPPPPAQPTNSSGANALIDSLGATVTPQGYRVGPGLSPQLRGAGLVPGDVVASVNGLSAASLASDPRRLAQVMASGQARVEVVRGGNRITLSVPVR